MSLQKQQDILARIYTDAEFRGRFLSDPELAAAAGLSRTDAIQLASAAADEVRWFADSLTNKRLREVAKMLPLTHLDIGARAFEEEFRQFAVDFSPTSVKKHLEDSLAFADLLIRREIDASVKSLIHFESRRLRHTSLDRAVSFCVLRRDPRKLPSKGIGLWIAVKRWSRIFFRPNLDD
ncbi:MAG: hypothetical protein PSX80_01105 [bacterium]|nr:hypothetical protein [bacterium]